MSPVWSTWLELYDNNVKIKFILCKLCNEVRAYNSKDGTTSLKLHSCSTRITAYTTAQVELNKHEKQGLLDCQVYHVSSGLLSFRQSENEGLLALLNKAVQLGAKYGKFDISKSLSNRKAVSDRTASLAAKIKCDYEDDLKALKGKSLCLVTDGWSDSVNKNCYVDYSVQYVNENFELKSIQIDMVHFPEAKTSVNIRNYIYDKCDALNLDPFETSIITDSAPNMVKACQGMQHFRCICHRFNSAIDKAFNISLQENNYLTVFDTSVNSLIGFANRTGIQHALPIKLKSGSATRPWRRFSDRFGSLNDSYDKLVEILEKVILKLLKNVSSILLLKIRRFIRHAASKFITVL